MRLKKIISFFSLSHGPCTQKKSLLLERENSQSEVLAMDPKEQAFLRAKTMALLKHTLQIDQRKMQKERAELTARKVAKNAQPGDQKRIRDLNRFINITSQLLHHEGLIDELELNLEGADEYILNYIERRRGWEKIAPGIFQFDNNAKELLLQIHGEILEKWPLKPFFNTGCRGTIETIYKRINTQIERNFSSTELVDAVQEIEQLASNAYYQTKNKNSEHGKFFSNIVVQINVLNLSMQEDKITLNLIH